MTLKIDCFTNMFFYVLLGIFNLLYFLIYYRDRSADILVFFALSVFVGILFVSKIIVSAPKDISELGFSSRKKTVCLLLFILFFSIPIILYPLYKRIIFWNFDVHAKIVLSWFLFSFSWFNLLRNKTNTNNFKDTLAPFFLLIVWSMVLWLNLIWDVGVSVLFARSISLDYFLQADTLAVRVFKIWETRPFHEHFGLAFTDTGLSKNKVYVHSAQIYLLASYLLVKFLQLFAGIKLEMATRLLPIYYSGLLSVVVLFFFIKTKIIGQIQKLKTQLTFFLGLGFLLSLPDFWIPMFKSSTDNIFPLTAYMTIALSGYVISDDYISKGFVWLLFAFCVLFPFYAFICLSSLVFYMFRTQNTYNYRTSINDLKKIFCSCIFLIAVALGYPLLVTKILGYEGVGATIIFRSGLDGDTSFYRNILQAVINPHKPASDLVRPWSSFFPAALLFSAGLIFGGWKQYRSDPKVLRSIVFLLAPYLASVVFFPQSVSIHPYLYDILLILPLGFLGMYWTCTSEFQERVNGPSAYLFFLFMIALVMYNLTMIAQVARLQ